MLFLLISRALRFRAKCWCLRCAALCVPSDLGWCSHRLASHLCLAMPSPENDDQRTAPGCARVSPVASGQDCTHAACRWRAPCVEMRTCAPLTDGSGLQCASHTFLFTWLFRARGHARRHRHRLAALPCVAINRGLRRYSAPSLSAGGAGIVGGIVSIAAASPPHDPPAV